MRKYLRDNLLTVGAKALSVLFLIAFNLIIGRALGPEGKGVISLSITLATYLGTVGTLGLDYGIIHYSKGKPELLRKGLAAAVWTWLLASLGFVLVLSALSPWRAYLGLGSLDGAAWALTVGSVPLFLGLKFVQEGLRAQEDFLWFNLLEAGKGLLAALVALGLVLWLKMGLWGGLLTVPGRALPLLLLGLGVLWARGLLGLKPDPELWRKSLVYGLKADIGQAFQFLNYRLGLFVLGAFWGAWEVGLYAAALGFAELLWYVSGSVAMTLFPRVSASGEDADRIAALTTRFTQGITFLGALLMALIGRWAILLVYGPQFSGSFLPLLLMLPGAWAFGYAKLSVAWLMGKGKPAHGTYLTFISLGAIIPASLLLIPPFGATGAALASGVVYTLGGLVGIYWFRRYSELPLREFLLPKPSDFGRLRRLLRRP